MTDLDLSRIRWRKASASTSASGNCVEVGAAWRKASASGSGTGNCVEVAALGACFAVRDSKDPDGSVLGFAATDWMAFVAAAGSGRL